MASLHPKTHITTFARTLVARTVAGQPLDVFIAGDDAAAKATIPQLVEAGSPTGRYALSQHYAPGPARHPLHERLEIALPMRTQEAWPQESGFSPEPCFVVEDASSGLLARAGGPGDSERQVSNYDETDQ